MGSLAQQVPESLLFPHLSVSGAFPTRYSASRWMHVAAEETAPESQCSWGAENLFFIQIHYFTQHSLWPPKQVPENKKPGQDAAEMREGKWRLCIWAGIATKKAIYRSESRVQQRNKHHRNKLKSTFFSDPPRLHRSMSQQCAHTLSLLIHSDLWSNIQHNQSRRLLVLMTDY